jgi:glutathione S-transferase
MSDVTIYWGSGSPFAWRALLTAELKGVDYESALISFGDGDLRKPEYLEMNPRARSRCCAWIASTSTSHSR